MSTAKMAHWLVETEKWDPITPQLIEGAFKNDSRAMESLGKKWNIPQLEQDARYNQQNPEEGIANASKATALGFLGAGIGNLFSGAGAYGAATPGVSQGSQQAAMLAQQTGDFGAFGLGKTMQAASGAQGLNPLMANFANNAGGLLSGGKNGAFAKRMAFNQGMNLMQPQQPPMPPPPPPQQQPQQQMPMPYMSEEEKERLRRMGYTIY